MLKWVQSGLSVVAGTAEPEYGPDAIHPVTKSIAPSVQPWRPTTVEDFAWKQPDYTNVETQTFYFTCLNTGDTGFAQVIHSNVMGVHTTAQFTFRLFNSETKKTIWTLTKLNDFKVDGSNFYAEDLLIEFSKDGKLVHLKSNVNPDSIIDFEMTRLTEGVIFGKDGTTLYGDDVENPWGSMRHVFWPRCSVKGTISTLVDAEVADTPRIIPIEGFTMFVMALQGMKPHHAAKSWNFLNFQSENYSAVQMEFTTPRSYATTKVNIGIVCLKDKVIIGSIDNTVVHENSKIDEIGWPVPQSIVFNFDGNSGAEQTSNIIVKGDLTTLVERVDVMAEIPQFVKNIVSNVAGTKPFIYQYCNTFAISVDDLTSEKGIAFNEATFISE
ncbi:putative cell survival pathways protein [Scheffersomyces spartinae]|uniref:Cell survival pathways protein n=1 Tax=Scheffersomyces spartinae TaxID=45513 RepID=A0A9P8AJC9_9ASCO|nr:putative cell survival pathways protein [Scheffersomyces spartinae]KAG7194027.1 putative cell survival pathways protein [Scheffersomyces spartinae]